MVKSSFFFFFFFFINFSFAQKLSIVYLKDKSNNDFVISEPQNFLSTRAILRRDKQNIGISERDLPVSRQYIDTLNTRGLKVVGSSKWLNALLVQGNLDQINQYNFGFIKSSTELNRASSEARVFKESALKTLPSSVRRSGIYGQAHTQVSMLGVDLMHSAGYKGQGMMIAVFDEGFYNVNKLSAFDSINQQNRIVATYNFQNRTKDVYTNGTHGTNVLSCLAANLPNNIIGTAPSASYVLLKTEVAEYELPTEEFFWVQAAEFSDSIGVDIINSSLGYTDFDVTSLNHSYADMDGKTTICSRAAKIASEVGILVCNSAGNEGAKSWKYIKAPADAESIIAVGAVSAEGNKSSFSSFGPSADGRIKPDLSAMGSSVAVINAFTGEVEYRNGTSFASPLLCGLAAGVWQANPKLTNIGLIEFLKSTATNSSSPNNQVGYGIPRFQNPQQLAEKFLSNLLVTNPITNQILEIKLKYDLITSQSANFTIYDSFGKEVINFNNINFFENRDYQISVPLQQGIYILRLHNAQSHVEYKLCVL